MRILVDQTPQNYRMNFVMLAAEHFEIIDSLILANDLLDLSRLRPQMTFAWFPS
jgi:hypothetical protein